MIVRSEMKCPSMPCTSCSVVVTCVSQRIISALRNKLDSGVNRSSLLNEGCFHSDKLSSYVIYKICQIHSST
jgi:hypothetical protein